MITTRLTGYRATIQHLTKYKSSLEEMKKQFLERLAQIGIEKATIEFSVAIYDGTNDVVVQQTPEWENENTLRVVASGGAILFIEFGAGARVNEFYPDPGHPSADEFGYTRGTYGKGHGRQRTWGYYGDPGTNGEVNERGVVLTHGNPANACMYTAAKSMRDQIVLVAQEVFGNK